MKDGRIFRMLHIQNYFSTFDPYLIIMETEIPLYRHFTSIQRRFNDYDVLGHVNNAVYQHYFDLARLSYFEDVIGEKLLDSPFSLVMANISIDYFSPIVMQELTTIRSMIEVIGNKSVTMIQEIFNPETGEVKAFSRAVLVVYSVKAKKSSEIPALWSEKIFHFEDRVKWKETVGNNSDFK